LSVTLFLVAITEVCKGISEPTKMAVYADNRIAEARLKKVTNKVTKYTSENRLKISTNKTKSDKINDYS
jgi:hypothetical protein